MKARHPPILLVRRISLILALFAFVALFAVQAEPAAADSPSHVRLIQASPDIATVAVFVDGKVLLSAFTFTPAAIISDANVCRPSCGVIGSSLAAAHARRPRS